jgi:hypothetical protein
MVCLNEMKSSKTLKHLFIYYLRNFDFSAAQQHCARLCRFRSEAEKERPQGFERSSAALNARSALNRCAAALNFLNGRRPLEQP